MAMITARKSTYIMFVLVCSMMAPAATLHAQQMLRARATGYIQHNLVSDGFVAADHTDTNLKNPWGVSFFPGVSPFWVSDNAAGVSTLYDGAGVAFPPPPTGPLIVNIPLSNAAT